MIHSHERYSGIILRCHARKMQVALLDNVLGRIDTIVQHITLCSGSLITYHIEYRNNRYYIDSIEIIYVPLLLARTDLAFFHHILELCFYSIPVGSYAQEVFELVSFLVKEEYILYNNMINKKLLLGKLLYLLGIYSEYPMSNNTSFLHNFLLLSIDKVKDNPLNLECEKELDAWLRQCIAEHPWFSRFKTVRFLD